MKYYIEVYQHVVKRNLLQALREQVNEITFPQKNLSFLSKIFIMTVDGKYKTSYLNFSRGLFKNVLIPRRC